MRFHLRNKTVNDNSLYYDADRALKEEIEWILRNAHGKIIDWLKPRAANLQTVVEFGCGSGIVAASLTPKTYLGIDANPHFLRMAKMRLVDRDTFAFIKDDVRTAQIDGTFDLAMAWSFFKHFSLQELYAIMSSVLIHGHHGAFNVQIFERDFDNGTDFHHIHVTEERLSLALRQAGHREVERATLSEWPLAGATAKDVAIWTERIHE